MIWASAIKKTKNKLEPPAMKTALFSGGLRWRQNIADVRYLSCSTRRATYFATTSICINQQLRDENNKNNNKTAWWCVGEQMTFFCLAFLLHLTTFCNKVVNNNKEINSGKRFHFLKPSRKLLVPGGSSTLITSLRSTPTPHARGISPTCQAGTAVTQPFCISPLVRMADRTPKEGEKRYLQKCSSNPTKCRRKSVKKNRVQVVSFFFFIARRVAQLFCVKSSILQFGEKESRFVTPARRIALVEMRWISFSPTRPLLSLRPRAKASAIEKKANKKITSSLYIMCLHPIRWSNLLEEQLFIGWECGRRNNVACPALLPRTRSKRKHSETITHTHENAKDPYLCRHKARRHELFRFPRKMRVRQAPEKRSGVPN
ncbi:hypothetical protein, conserved in T.vivax [Trypanosoma vivax Y486]|uniref:Uncharacterized protein n=1 Tax=Trypanosoma vivax (strain Y486) TaxID=1055687 RepID=F9WQ12_TRYVY|nr:hypothetical protein, conserved in T.vivax [Trypanosoma vivax Y486]|eukprot:CCD19639.1 hypothetical protein, conserved in T.vivax [Trypanosoma vivax Y486]